MRSDAVSDPSHPLGFLSGGGEMGALFRAHDWSAAPLGPVEEWPQSLRSAVGLMLANRHPMFVAWGPKLTLLYNDGYVPVLGQKHPGALGRPFREVWPEIWDTIEPLANTALAGEATRSEDLHLVMERNGYPEDSWHTFSYSPIRDESGAVAGLFCAGSETTARVSADRRQAFLLDLEERLRATRTASEALDAACEALGRALGGTICTYNELDGEHIDVTGEWRAQGVPSVRGRHFLAEWGAGRIEDLMSGQPELLQDITTDPRTVGSSAEAAYAALGCRSSLNVPYVRDRQVRAMLAVGTAQPRAWSDEEVALAQAAVERTWHAAERARAEASVRESESKLRLLFGGSPAPMLVLAPDSPRFTITDVNDAYLAATMRTRGDLVGRGIFEAFPDNPDDVDIRGVSTLRASLERVLAKRQPDELPGLKYDIARSDGTFEERWWSPVNSAVMDDNGAVVAIIHNANDVTKAYRSDAALRESEALLNAVIEAMPVGVIVADAQGRIVRDNAATRDLWGVLPETIGVEQYGEWEGYWPDTGERIQAHEWGMARALLTGEVVSGELVENVRFDTGERRMFLNYASPVRDADGGIIAGVVAAVDVTEDRRTQAALRDSEERYRQIVEGADDFAIVTLDPHGIITGWNTGAQRMIGFSETEAVGRPGHIFFTPEDREAGVPDHEMARAHSDGRAVDERWHIRKDGGRFWGSGLMMRLDGSDGGFLKMFRDRTAEHEAEAALRASERELRFTLEAGRFGAWSLDLVTGELTTSETCRTNFGREPDAPFTYGDLREAIHRDDRERMAAVVEESVATGADYDIEYRIVTPRGEVRWVLIRAQPSYNADGTPLKMTGVSIDITDRKRDEARKAALVELSDAIRDIYSQDDLAYAASRILGRTLGVNRAGYGTIDMRAETIAIERDWNAPGVDSIAGTLSFRDYGSYIDDLKRGGTVVVANVETDPRTAATADALKAIDACSFINMPVTEGGDFVALIFVNHGEARVWTDEEVALVREVADRTRTAVERLRIEAELKESEQRYRTLFENIDAGFCVIEVLFDDAGQPFDYRFVETNPAFEAQTGLVDAVGRTMRDLAPAHEQHWFDLYGGVALTGTSQRFENEAAALGRWFEVYAYRVGAPEQRRVAVLFNDATVRKRTEKALREFNERLAEQVAARAAERDRLWNLSPDMLARADYGGMMSAVSPAWGQVLGWNEAELLSREYATFMHPDDMPPTLDAIGRMAKTGQPTRFENRIATRDGGWTPIEWTVAPEPDGVNFIAVGRDLSEAKAREAELETAQEALRQSQKMEAMGSLTGGVAHDFNNLLTPILGSLDMLQRRGIGNEREQRLIAGALQSADRAKVLVQRLLAFARRQPLQPTSVELAPLVRGMADLVSSTTGPQIRVVVDAPDGLPPAKADPNQLEMAILNLAVNARDAMPDGGTLRISVGAEKTGAQHPAGIAVGRYLRLSVADTGIGMDEETLRRAIEPFYSTKGIGKGTGLGLSMVHGLASQLGGGLAIHSTPGVGTNVELWLPRSEEPSATVEPNSATLAAAKGSGTVLLVDDEDLVRLSTADMLAELGYAVVEASSGEEALRLVDGGLEPDLLVTDHLMPGMPGTQLAQEVRGRRPGIKVLVVSGYAEMDGIAPDLARLTKPFRNSDLAASIEALE